MGVEQRWVIVCDRCYWHAARCFSRRSQEDLETTARKEGWRRRRVRAVGRGKPIFQWLCLWCNEIYMEEMQEETVGREISRVPTDFSFPLEASYADHCYDVHRNNCDKDGHAECDWNGDPPEGDGWQLWQTVSGGPISPVFATPEELIDWMCVPVKPVRRAGPWAQGWDREVAEHFVRIERKVPTLSWGQSGVKDGAQAAFDASKREK